jgi:flagellar protein FlgJ
MTSLPASGPSRSTSAPTDLRKPVHRPTRDEVRRLSHELEAVFVNQLFQAMRASVPQDDLVGHVPGQEMFTAIMDERLASEAAQRMRGGLGESLYRQLARRLPQATEETAP